MNMLTDSVPESLTIAGTEYEINTDYSVWLKFEMLLSDEVEDSKATLLDIKKLIFKSEIPPDRADEEATEKILWFYRCGKPHEKQSGKGNNNRAIFNYDYDDSYIYAAFLEQYGVDLNDADIHWWKFRALFQSLKDDCQIVKIMGIRSIKITSKMSAAERDYYQKMKRLYALPLPQTELEKYNEIEDALLSGKPVDELL